MALHAAVPGDTMPLERQSRTQQCYALLDLISLLWRKIGNHSQAGALRRVDAHLLDRCECRCRSKQEYDRASMIIDPSGLQDVPNNTSSLLVDLKAIAEGASPSGLDLRAGSCDVSTWESPVVTAKEKSVEGV